MAKRKRRVKSRGQLTQEAIHLLHRVLAVEEPHIQVRFDGGLADTPEARELLQALKRFSDTYKRFYALEKVNVVTLL